MLDKYPFFQQCQKCGKTYPQTERPDPTKPTPCCGSDEANFQWPELGAGTMLDVVAAQDLDNHDERKIALVFLAAVLESFVEDPIITLLPKRYKTREEAVAALEDNEGKKRRINFLGKLLGKPLQDLLAEKGFPRYLSDWGDLALVRNHIMHGKFFASHKGTDDEKELIKRVYMDCLPVFSVIQNEAIAQLKKIQEWNG
jgi:hypothetical protein